MSAHTCREYTPGCFRCDLNLDELDDGQLRESLRIARVEVAALRANEAQCEGLRIKADNMRLTAERDLSALREECEMLRGTYQNLNELWGGAATRCAERAEKAEHELAEARALLARILERGYMTPEDGDATRAFLRRDEARWEPSDNVFTHDEKKP